MAIYSSVVWGHFCTTLFVLENKTEWQICFFYVTQKLNQITVSWSSLADHVVYFVERWHQRLALSCFCVLLRLQKGQSLKRRHSSPSPPSSLRWARPGLWTHLLMAVLRETCPACRPPSLYTRCLRQANAHPVQHPAQHPAWAAAVAIPQYVHLVPLYVKQWFFCFHFCMLYIVL